MDSHTGETGEYGYGVSVQGGKNILIENMTLEKCWGDGLNLQVLYSGYVPPENVIIRNITCTYNRRNNLSLEGGIHVAVEDCIFSHAGGTAPQSGVDIEPWATSGVYVQDVRFTNCKILNNTGYGFMIIGNDGSIDNVVLQDCWFEGNNGRHLHSLASNNIVVDSCYFGAINQGLYLDGEQGHKIINNTFEDCVYGLNIAGTTKYTTITNNMLNNTASGGEGARLAGEFNNFSNNTVIGFETNVCCAGNYIELAHNEIQDAAEKSIIAAGTYLEAYGNRISGSNWDDNNGSCVSLQEGADYCKFTDNTFIQDVISGIDRGSNRANYAFNSTAGSTYNVFDRTRLVPSSTHTAIVLHSGTLDSTSKIIPWPNVLLWSGSWSSGNQTVPGLLDYKVYLVSFSGTQIDAICFRSSTYITGLGGAAVVASGPDSLHFSATYSGETLTMSYVQRVRHPFSASHNAGSSYAVSAIYGLL